MTKKSKGRAQITINWEEVDKFLIAGCSGQDIANTLGISNDTLFRRCVKVHKMNFSDYAVKKRQKGNLMLHMAQFNNAMKGNTSMQIWLGKQRLGQSDQPKSKEEFNTSLGNLLDLMHLVDSAEDFNALIKLAKNNAAIKPVV